MYICTYLYVHPLEFKLASHYIHIKLTKIVQNHIAYSFHANLVDIVGVNLDNDLNNSWIFFSDRDIFLLFFFIWIEMYTTAKRILERLRIQTSSSFVKIWYVCIPNFKANFLFFWRFYGLVFYLETIGVH